MTYHGLFVLFYLFPRYLLDCFTNYTSLHLSEIINSIKFDFAELVETERLHRYPRADREHSQRLLAYDMARERVLHRHVNKDFRLYQGSKRQHVVIIKTMVVSDVFYRLHFDIFCDF